MIEPTQPEMANGVLERLRSEGWTFRQVPFVCGHPRLGRVVKLTWRGNTMLIIPQRAEVRWGRYLAWRAHLEVRN